MLAKFLANYPAAIKLVEKNWEELIAFYNFPSSKHLVIDKNDESDWIGFFGTEATNPIRKEVFF